MTRFGRLLVWAIHNATGWSFRNTGDRQQASITYFTDCADRHTGDSTPFLSVDRRNAPGAHRPLRVAGSPFHTKSGRIADTTGRAIQGD